MAKLLATEDTADEGIADTTNDAWDKPSSAQPVIFTVSGRQTPGSLGSMRASEKNSLVWLFLAHSVTSKPLSDRIMAKAPAHAPDPRIHAFLSISLNSTFSLLFPQPGFGTC